MDWMQLLVIILAVFLALFLLLATILTVKLIQISRQIKNITNAAEKTAINVQNMTANAAAAMAPGAILKVVKTFINKSKK